METMDTTTTDKAKAIKEKAEQVYREEAAKRAQELLTEAIEDAESAGKFDGLNKTQSAEMINSLAVVAMSRLVAEEFSSNFRPKHCDITSWGYHADKIVGAAWNAAMLAAVAGGVVWLAKRGEKAAGSVETNTTPDAASTNSQYSDTTPAAFTASPRPSKHGLAI